MIGSRPRKFTRAVRCTICGRFYSEVLPDDSACRDHIYDYNRRQENERRREPRQQGEA